MATVPFSAASGASLRLTALEAEMNAKSTSLRSSLGRHLDRYLLAHDLELLADGTLGRAEADGLQREVALFQDAEKDLAHRAGGANDGNAALVQCVPPMGKMSSSILARWGRPVPVRMSGCLVETISLVGEPVAKLGAMKLHGIRLLPVIGE